MYSPVPAIMDLYAGAQWGLGGSAKCAARRLHVRLSAIMFGNVPMNAHCIRTNRTGSFAGAYAIERLDRAILVRRSGARSLWSYMTRLSRGAYPLTGNRQESVVSNDDGLYRPMAANRRCSFYRCSMPLVIARHLVFHCEYSRHALVKTRAC